MLGLRDGGPKKSRSLTPPRGCQEIVELLKLHLKMAKVAKSGRKSQNANSVQKRYIVLGPGGMESGPTHHPHARGGGARGLPTSGGSFLRSNFFGHFALKPSPSPSPPPGWARPRPTHPLPPSSPPSLLPGHQTQKNSELKKWLKK